MASPTKLIPFGTVYGELTVLDQAKEHSENGAAWWCVCTCGNILPILAGRLRAGTKKVCGSCNWVKRFPVEHKAWSDMHTRCNNPTVPGYKHYGGRGIKVCKRWYSFAAFLHDMGPKPMPFLSIDRNDNDGDYEPDNCSWETKSHQNSNRRFNIT